jgi:membrane protease YdiL (CAAX protease family)
MPGRDRPATADGDQVRVSPRPWIGLAVVAAYLAVLWILGRSLRGAAGASGSEAGKSLFSDVIPMVAVALGLVVATTLLGWWRPVLVESDRSPLRWPLIAAVIAVLSIALHLVGTEWSRVSAAYVLVTLVSCLLVGVCEELAARGLLLTALRARLSEVWVWLLSSLIFAAMHATNLLGGQDLWSTTTQVVNAFFAGTMLYVIRRCTGLLVWAMIVHALWDFAIGLNGFAPSGVPSTGTSQLVAFAAEAFAFVGLIVMFVRSRIGTRRQTARA